MTDFVIFISFIGSILFIIFSIRVTFPIIKVIRFIRRKYGWPGPIYWEKPKNVKQLIANPVISKKKFGIFKLYFSSMSTVLLAFICFLFTFISLYYEHVKLDSPEKHYFIIIILTFIFITGFRFFLRSLRIIKKIKDM